MTTLPAVDFKKHEELWWWPGPKHRLAYGDGPYKVVFITGDGHLRGKSNCFVREFDKCVLILNTRLRKIE